MTQLNLSPLASRKINPQTIVASVLYLAFVVCTILRDEFRYSPLNAFDRLASWFSFSSYGFVDGIIYLYWDLESLVFPLLGIAAAVFGLVSRRPTFQLLLGASLFVSHFVLHWVFQVYFSVTRGAWQFYFVPDSQELESWLLASALLVAIFLSGRVWLSSKNSESTPNQVADTSVFVQPQAATAAPVSATRSYDNLPLFALIGAFVIPLAGIILGHLSLSYMKKGQLSEQNKGMAKAGLILGYVFVGLSLLFGMFFAIIFVVAALTGAL